MTVYVPGLSGESLAIYRALQTFPDSAGGVRFVGAHFPGINESNYLGLHPEARVRAYFMHPSIRSEIGSGRVELIPTDYPGIGQDLAALPIDMAVAQVSPPDAEGRCSIGLGCDFLPVVWKKALFRLAHINPALPRTRSSFTVLIDECDAIYEASAPLVEYDVGRADERQIQHARHVCELVDDGDVLQFGVGKIQTAILQALTNHRRLRIYSGMISSPVLALLESGAIDLSVPCDVGVALGDAAFYAALDQHRQFYFRPASETHNVLRIAEIENFRAINSAIEVDLFGQVNSDIVGSALVAGVGGLPAFVGGARSSPGGRSIVVLPAATPNGKVSRIVSTLGSPGLVAISRHAADFVVTEHGIAALRGLSIEQRAAALIRIADPKFQEQLSAEWHELFRKCTKS